MFAATPAYTNTKQYTEKYTQMLSDIQKNNTHKVPVLMDRCDRVGGTCVDGQLSAVRRHVVDSLLKTK